MTTQTCPHCARVVTAAASCADCGSGLPPLPYLMPAKPAQWKDTLWCFAAGLGIVGMIISAISAISIIGGNDSFGGAIACVAFLVFSALTALAFRKSQDYAPAASTFSAEEWNQIVAHSPEPQGIFAAPDGNEKVFGGEVQPKP